jgi:OCT family organic cation transporter-like MFS transporter 18
MSFQAANNSNNATVLIIYANIALYAMCYQMQRPLEPFLVDSLVTAEGSGTAEYARLQSFFFVIQTLGSLGIGRLIDSIGYKRGFYLNFAASALSYFILSESKTLFMLYLSKVPTMFQAGFLCAQVALTQKEFDPSSRVALLGRLTTAYTLGAIVGPYIGGYLGTTGDYYYGAKVACVGSLLSLVITFFLPSVSGAEYIQMDIASNSDLGKMQKQSIIQTAMSVWLLLSIKITSNVSNAIGSTIMPIVFKNDFKLDEYQLGLSMSVMSAFNAFASGIALAPLVSMAGNDLDTVISVSIWALVGMLYVQTIFALPLVVATVSYSRGFIEYFICTLLLSMAQFVLSNTLTAESTQRVQEDSKVVPMISRIM